MDAGRVPRRTDDGHGRDGRQGESGRGGGHEPAAFTVSGDLLPATPDGWCRAKHWAGRTLVSANVPFLADLAEIIGARFTPARKGLASHLILVDRWAARGTFRPEYHDADPVEAGWVTVESVRPRPAPGKPFTVYGYRLRPYPSFLVNGHPVRAAA